MNLISHQHFWGCDNFSLSRITFKQGEAPSFLDAIGQVAERVGNDIDDLSTDAKKAGQEALKKLEDFDRGARQGRKPLSEVRSLTPSQIESGLVGVGEYFYGLSDKQIEQKITALSKLKPSMRTSHIMWNWNIPNVPPMYRVQFVQLFLSHQLPIKVKDDNIFGSKSMKGLKKFCVMTMERRFKNKNNEVPNDQKKDLDQMERELNDLKIRAKYLQSRVSDLLKKKSKELGFKSYKKPYEEAANELETSVSNKEIDLSDAQNIFALMVLNQSTVNSLTKNLEAISGINEPFSITTPDGLKICRDIPEKQDGLITLENIFYDANSSFKDLEREVGSGMTYAATIILDAEGEPIKWQQDGENKYENQDYDGLIIGVDQLTEASDRLASSIDDFARKILSSHEDLFPIGPLIDYFDDDYREVRMEIENLKKEGDLDSKTAACLIALKVLLADGERFEEEDEVHEFDEEGSNSKETQNLRSALARARSDFDQRKNNFEKLKELWHTGKSDELIEKSRIIASISVEDQLLAEGVDEKDERSV